MRDTVKYLNAIIFRRKKLKAKVPHICCVKQRSNTPCMYHCSLHTACFEYCDDSLQ